MRLLDRSATAAARPLLPMPRTRRLRRPAPLPTVVPTCATGRYLRRLLWLFGGL